MEKILVVTVLLLAAFGAPFTLAQEKPDRLKSYIDEATNILVVRIVSQGPVNILMQSRTNVKVLQVVKGDAKLADLTLVSRVDMKPGKLYLIRTTGKTETSQNSFYIDDHASAIPISGTEDLELLKKLSPRIVVLRTMNVRADELKHRISRDQYELELIDHVREGN